MDDTTKKAVIQRFASVSGHMNGVRRMVEEDTYCIDVIRQIQAVQAALNKISAMILDNHLHTCVTGAIQGQDPEDRERIFKEITSVFEVTGKL